MIYLRALIGIVVLLSLAWLMSSNRRRFPWRVVIWGIGMQLGLAFLILGTGTGYNALEGVRLFIEKLASMTQQGATNVFGDLGVGSGDPENGIPPGKLGFIFAFSTGGLIVIIFFAALMSVLYHLGIMQIIIWALARVMSWLLGVSGAESLAMAANVFVGQTEAPLVVRPYLSKMTMSEMNALMTGGFATVAGSVLAVYMKWLGSDVGQHLLTASLLSAPAAFVIAKIVVPETEQSTTAGKVELRFDRTAHNLIEAAANGTQDGLKLWLNVIAMLIAFMAFIALINWPLGWAGTFFFDMQAGELSLQWIFGWLLSPLAWCVGVDGWQDCRLFGSLIGVKLVSTEFVAFADMKEMVTGDAFEHARSAKLVAYALCGFANFASIGIQIGGITPLAPERKTDLSRLAMRAMLGGALASSCTAAVAGMFIA